MTTPSGRRRPPAHLRARAGTSRIRRLLLIPLAALAVAASPAMVGSAAAQGTGRDGGGVGPVVESDTRRPGNSTDGPVVRTDAGLLRGRVTADHRIFEGIPYARPPVGDFRLRAPRPVVPWTGIRDATEPGSMCAQVFVFPPGSPPKFSGSEDCLYLNVHVPRGVEEPMPVMVFLHGGGFGGGNGAAYDPRRVTRQGEVIVVTVNYRLGALGFLRHPALGDRWAGNFGIADQQAALWWVRRNIAAFGGDAGNVTLWGESAGAYSVCAQLASPAARGLFDKAIAQSGPCGNDFLTRREARHRARAAVEELGCADAHPVAACLREVPAREISALGFERVRLTRHITNLPWLPVAGTAPMPLQPMMAVRTGVGNVVPMIVGGTRDEMRTFVVDRYEQGLGLVTPAEYPRLVRKLYGDDAQRVLAEYPHARYDSPSIALATLLTDEGRAAGACRQLAFSDVMTRRAPVFVYEFAEPTGKTSGGFPDGALHGADIPYFFDSYWEEAPTPMPEPQARLARTLIGHWTTFARTGDPGPGWATYHDDHALSFATDRVGDVDLATNHRCAFWRML